MQVTQARAFAERWQTAWNDHDLEAVLSHFTDDVVFTSPVAGRVIPSSAGVLRGKDELRAYWTTALARIDDLRFDVIDVYTGVDTVVINYRNHLGGRVCEVLRFRGELVSEGHGAYLVADAAGASGA